MWPRLMTLFSAPSVIPWFTESAWICTLISSSDSCGTACSAAHAKSVNSLQTPHPTTISARFVTKACTKPAWSQTCNRVSWNSPASLPVKSASNATFARKSLKWFKPLMKATGSKTRSDFAPSATTRMLEKVMAVAFAKIFPMASTSCVRLVNRGTAFHAVSSLKSRSITSKIRLIFARNARQLKHKISEF